MKRRAVWRECDRCERCRPKTGDELSLFPDGEELVLRFVEGFETCQMDSSCRLCRSGEVRGL